MKTQFSSSQSDREFQLWEYQVSHGQLLVRSPKGPGVGMEPERLTNIDLVFVGVQYVTLPRFLKGLEVVAPTVDEIRTMEEILGRHMSRRKVFIVVSEGRRFPIAAVAFSFSENDWYLWTRHLKLDRNIGRRRSGPSIATGMLSP